jgi:hypothetical protein
MFINNNNIKIKNSIKLKKEYLIKFIKLNYFNELEYLNYIKNLFKIKENELNFLINDNNNDYFIPLKFKNDLKIKILLKFNYLEKLNKINFKEEIIYEILFFNNLKKIKEIIKNSENNEILEKLEFLNLNDFEWNWNFNTPNHPFEKFLKIENYK